MAKRKSKNRNPSEAQLRWKCERFINWYLKKVGLLPLVVCTSDSREWRFPSVLLRPTEEDEDRKRARKLCKIFMDFAKAKPMASMAQMGRVRKNVRKV